MSNSLGFRSHLLSGPHPFFFLSSVVICPFLLFLESNLSDMISVAHVPSLISPAHLKTVL